MKTCILQAVIGLDLTLELELRNGHVASALFQHNPSQENSKLKEIPITKIRDIVPEHIIRIGLNSELPSTVYAMGWFLNGISPIFGWNIAFLGLIPWLGQCAIAPHVESLILSPFCLLPRIIPGPQALRSPSRSWSECQKELPKIAAHLDFLCDCASHSPQSFVHVVSPTMNSIEAGAPFSINFWSVGYKPERLGLPIQPSLNNHTDGYTSSRSWKFNIARLRGSLQSTNTADVLNILSFLITIGLIALAIVQRDGAALVSLLILSLNSAKDGHTWQVRMREKVYRDMHQVIFKTEANIFYLAFCDEIALNALIHGKPMHLDNLLSYKTHLAFTSNFSMRLCFDASFILIGAFTFNMQVALATAYVILTILFTLLQPKGIQSNEIMISPRFHLLANRANIHDPNARLKAERQPSLAKTVWSLMKITESVAWVHSIQAIPDTPGWEKWYGEACNNLSSSGWPAEAEKQRLVDNNINAYDEDCELNSSQTPQNEPSIHSVNLSQWSSN